MGLFTRYAMDALMKTSHPEVVRRQCWNLHPHRTPCTDCKDICPYGDAIFTRPNLVKDWDPCTDCGLCVSVCRSGCIVPSPEQVQRDTSLADTDNDTLWLGCEKSSRKNTAVRACVAAFSWETLAYLALNKKTQVITPTLLGEMIFDVVYCSIRQLLNPELTASWEKGLNYVAEGSITSQEYMDKLEHFVRIRTDQVEQSNYQYALRQFFDAAAVNYQKKQTTSKRGGKV